VPAHLIGAVLAAFAYVLVPGAGLCLATRSVEGRSLFTATAIAFGMGTAGVGMVSLFLALVGWLDPVGLTAAWVVLTGVGWTLALRRGVLGRHVDGWRSDARADPWATVTTAVVIVAIGVVRWTVAPVGNIAPTVLRYWADGLEIADAGGIPDDTLHWGVLIPPATSKVVLNAFNGGASYLLGRDPIEATGALLFVVSIGLVITAVALLREMGIRWLAPLGAILLFANALTGSEFTTDLWFNLAEDWGRLVALSAVLVVVVFCANRSRTDPVVNGHPSDVPGIVVGGVLLGASAGFHLVAAAVATAMVGAAIVASVLVWHRARALLVAGGSIIGIALLLGTTILLIPGGDLGFEGAAGNDRYDALRAELGLDENFDPTRFISTHDVDLATNTPDVGFADVGKAFAYRMIGRRAPHARSPAEPISGVALVVPIVVASLLVIGSLLWAPRDLRTSLIWAALVSITLFLVGVVFAVGYDAFVLEIFGDRRLFMYSLIPTVVMVVGGCEWAMRWIADRFSGLRTAAAIGSAVVIVGALVFLPQATWKHAPLRQALNDQRELLRWAGEHTPCEGRILANRRTLGTFESITGRAAVLEGMGPHVRPSLLVRAIEEIFAARAFFLDPRADFLRERGVATVVIAEPGNTLGGYPAMTGIRRALLEDLDLREAFQNPAGTVYLMNDFRPNPALPSVSGRAGFACGAGPPARSIAATKRPSSSLER
jgi:hypothetical protein